MPFGQFDPNAPVRPGGTAPDQMRQALATSRAARPASPYDKGAAPINLSKPMAPMRGGAFAMQPGPRTGVTPPWPEAKAALATGAAPAFAGAVANPQAAQLAMRNRMQNRAR